MPNIQFEQEKYGSRFLHEEEARPWFIRLIFNMGLTKSEVAASIISSIVAVLIIVFAVMFYLKNRTVPEIPQHFRDLPNYQQDIYTTFYE